MMCRRLHVLAIFLILVGALSCEHFRSDPQSNAPEDMLEAGGKYEEVTNGSSFEGTSDESECLGTLVPPPGEYFQETAITSRGSLEEVQERARRRLRDRICQGVLCGFIEQHITIWNNTQSSGFRCTMAVLQQRHYDEWTKRVETLLSWRLEEDAAGLIASLRAAEIEHPRVSIVAVVDQGVAGGSRAEWLYRHLQAALQLAGAHLVAVPPEWGGRGIPVQVDGLVRAELFLIGGVESSLEIGWEIETRDRVFSGQLVRIPERIAPTEEDFHNFEPLDLRSDSVGLHIAGTRDGGGLCPGQTFRLLAETDRDMHVRVLNLTGPRAGTVIFPARSEQASLVPGVLPFSLGVFAAIGGGSAASRFLIIAAPTSEGLGRYATVDQYCRLPETMVEELQRGEGVPDGDEVFVSVTGYRVVDDEDCQSEPPDTVRISEIEQVVRTAPWCW